MIIIKAQKAVYFCNDSLMCYTTFVMTVNMVKCSKISHCSVLLKIKCKVKSTFFLLCTFIMTMLFVIAVSSVM